MVGGGAMSASHVVAVVDDLGPLDRGSIMTFAHRTRFRKAAAWYAVGSMVLTVRTNLWLH